MKRNRKLLAVLALGILAGSTAWADNSAAGALTKADEAYLAGDFAAMTAQMRAAIEAQPADPLIRSHALELLRKAYVVHGTDSMPVDWHLPDAIKRMTVTVKRTEKDFGEYSIFVNGTMVQPNVIRQIRLTRFPDQVVIDKQAGLGEWEESPDPSSGMPTYYIASPRTRDQVPGGLYLIHIELSDGRVTEGWVLVDDSFNATTSPTVYSPAMNEVIETGNPTFRFEDYRSPQYQPNERRSVWFEVARMEPPKYEWDPKWNLWMEASSVTQVTVGKSADGLSIDHLDDGHYVFFVGFKERVKFGDIWVGREGSTSRPFTVRQ